MFDTDVTPTAASPPPVTTYPELVDAYRQLDELTAEMRAMHTAGAFSEEYGAVNRRYATIVARLENGPEWQLLRALWYVDNWQEGTDRFGDAHLELDDETVDVGDVIAVGRVVAAELRRLRPELAADATTAEVAP